MARSEVQRQRVQDALACLDAWYRAGVFNIEGCIKMDLYAGLQQWTSVTSLDIFCCTLPLASAAHRNAA